ncbi:MAG: hypothetical protein RR550_00055 [Rikenellaceae bacterium]
MVDRTEIIRRVLGVIDELGGCGDTNVANDYPIASTLDQAGRELLMIAPVGAINRVKSFKTAPLTAKADGTGEVELPSDFVRMVSFRMYGWHKAVYETIATTSQKYARQFHRSTRGGVAQPVVALCGNKIQYFSVLLDSVHLMEEADYVDFMEVDATYPSKLLDALVWLTAAKTLKIMSEYEASKMAMEEYERLIGNLFGRYGK